MAGGPLPPIFAIAAAFIWSITVISAVTFGVGQFGDAAVSLTERVKGAQISVTVETRSALVLIALFTARRRNEAALTLALAELDHRVKNMLAIVSAIVARTQETSPSMVEFVAAFDGRIRSMATTHELLSSRHWHGLPLAELVRRVLAPYATAGTVRIEGPDDVFLSAEAGQTIAMVLHELATNAAKFGVLSAKGGVSPCVGAISGTGIPRPECASGGRRAAARPCGHKRDRATGPA